MNTLQDLDNITENFVLQDMQFVKITTDSGEYYQHVDENGHVVPVYLEDPRKHSTDSSIRSKIKSSGKFVRITEKGSIHSI